MKNVRIGTTKNKPKKIAIKKRGDKQARNYKVSIRKNAEIALKEYADHFANIGYPSLAETLVGGGYEKR